MITATISPIIHIYNEINIGKFTGVKHYELVRTKNGKNQLTNKINISIDRKCALSRPDYWLRIRSQNKWSDWVTGLFKTSRKNVYIGDLEKKKHLVLFKFSDHSNSLSIYIFNNYYTRDLSNLWHHLVD